MQCPSCRNEFELAPGSPECPHCHHSFISSYYRRSPLQPGTVLKGEYRILEQVGIGAWSLVYAASRGGSEFAVKEYYPPGCQREEGRLTAQGPVGLWEFKKGLSQMGVEADLLSRVAHRSLLRFEESFQENGTAYLVSELIPGETLAQMARREGERLPEQQVLPYFFQLLAALEALHRAGLVHADIKPENIMVTPGENPRVVLLDFGAALERDKGNPRGDATPAYAAPEQLQEGARVDVKSDVYGLCATIYHILTGVRPTPARERMRGARLPEPPTRLVSEPLMAVLRTGLALDCEARATVAGLRRQLMSSFAPRVGLTLLETTFEGHQRGLVALDFSPDGRHLVSGDESGQVHLWTVAEGEGGRAQAPMPLFRHPGLSSLAFSPDGAVLATASRQGSLRLWAPPSGQEMNRPLIADGKPISRITFNPNGIDLAVGLADGTVQIWRQPGRLFSTLAADEAAITDLEFSGDGKKLAVSTLKKRFSLWEVESGQRLWQVEGLDRYLQTLAFQPGGAFLASGSLDRTVRLWEAESGLESEVLSGRAGAVVGVAFLSERLLAMVTGDGTVRLCLVDPAQELASVSLGVVARSLAASPCSGLLAVACGDRTIRLLRVSSEG